MNIVKTFRDFLKQNNQLKEDHLIDCYYYNYFIFEKSDSLNINNLFYVGKDYYKSLKAILILKHYHLQFNTYSQMTK